MEVLVNKTYPEYDWVSRYTLFPYYYNRKDGKYISGITSHLDKNNTRYVSHKVEHGDTLDTIAVYYYNNPLYYWAIADFNDITDPYENLKEGTILKIPTFNDIQYVL